MCGYRVDGWRGRICHGPPFLKEFPVPRNRPFESEMNTIPSLWNRSLPHLCRSHLEAVTRDQRHFSELAERRTSDGYHRNVAVRTDDEFREQREGRGALTVASFAWIIGSSEISPSGVCEENVPFECLMRRLGESLRVDIIGAFCLLRIAITLFRRGSHGGERKNRVERRKRKNPGLALKKRSRCIGNEPYATSLWTFYFWWCWGCMVKTLLLSPSRMKMKCIFPFSVARWAAITPMVDPINTCVSRERKMQRLCHVRETEDDIIDDRLHRFEQA